MMMMKLLPLRRLFSTTAVTRMSAETVAENIQTGTTRRKTYKPLLSRKTYLVDHYTNLMRKNAIILVLHNSTLLKADDREIRKNITKAGGSLHVIRGGVFNTTLKALEHPDPASIKAYYKHRKTVHPLMSLIHGPTAIITIPELSPSAVNGVLDVVQKTNNRLILLGGQINKDVVDRADVEEFRKLPSLEELQAQLVGVLTVLGGANLTTTLESTTKMLYLTVNEHKKNLEGPKEESSNPESIDA